MRVTILGCGDAFGSGGRFNTCFLLEGDGHKRLVDCGATALVALQRAGVEPAAIDAVILSHLHGDHFGGLPFLVLYDHYVARRTGPLTVAGPPGVEARVRTLMETMFPGSEALEPRFPLRFQELRAGAPAAVDGAVVTATEVEHPSGAPSHALRIEADARTFAYSGDTQWLEALTQVGWGADLYIVECTGADEAPPYHMAYATLAPRIPKLGARRVLLTHMGEAMLARVEAGEVDHEAAHDGMVIDLSPPNG